MDDALLMGRHTLRPADRHATRPKRGARARRAGAGSLPCLALLLGLLTAACGPQQEPTPEVHKDAISRVTRDLCMAASVTCELRWRGPRRRERSGEIPIETPEGPKITMAHVRSVLRPPDWSESRGDQEGETVFRNALYVLRYSNSVIVIEWIGPPAPAKGGT